MTAASPTMKELLSGEDTLPKLVLFERVVGVPSHVLVKLQVTERFLDSSHPELIELRQKELLEKVPTLNTLNSSRMKSIDVSRMARNISPSYSDARLELDSKEVFRNAKGLRQTPRDQQDGECS